MGVSGVEVRSVVTVGITLVAKGMVFSGAPCILCQRRKGGILKCDRGGVRVKG